MLSSLQDAIDSTRMKKINSPETQSEKPTDCSHVRRYAGAAALEKIIKPITVSTWVGSLKDRII